MKISEGELFNNTNLEISQAPHHGARLLRERRACRPSAAAPTSSSRSTSRSPSAPTGTFQIGAGFSSVENFIAPGADLAEQPVRPRPDARAAGADRARCASCSCCASSSRTSSTPSWTFAFDLYNQSRGFGTFYRNARGGTLTWGYPLVVRRRARSRHLQARGRQHHDRARAASRPRRRPAAPIAATIGREPVPRRRTSSLRASLSWDSRNNRLFPTDGWYHSLFAEYAEPVHRLGEQVRRAGAASPATTSRCGGRSSSRINVELGLDDRRPIRSACRSTSATSSAASTPSAASSRSRSVPSCSTQPPGDVGQQLGSLPLGGNMQIIFNSEIEFPLFKKVGISGVVFFDMGNAYNLEDRYCSGLQRKNSRIPISSTRASGYPSRSPTACASRSASASAGSRRSARCASSGVSRSTRSSAKTRSSSSSRSATSSEANRRWPLRRSRRMRCAMNRYLALGCLGSWLDGEPAPRRASRRARSRHRRSA